VGAVGHAFDRPAKCLPALPDQLGPLPACPLVGGAVDRLLFSDFAGAGVRSFYYSSHGKLAVAQDHGTADEPAAAAAAPSAYAGYAPKRAWMIEKSPPLDGASTDVPSPVTETLALAAAAHPAVRSATSLIDLSCGGHSGDSDGGGLLDAFARGQGRVSLGVTVNPAHAQALRDRGHAVLAADPFDAPLAVPDGRTFDLVALGRAMQSTNAPLAMLRRAKLLMNPGGFILVTADNLHSLLLEQYGPTWAGWAGHRALLSPAAIDRLAKAAGLRVRAMHTRTYAARAAQSVARNRTGLLPSAAELSADDLLVGRRIAGWARLLFDRRGRGDVIHAVLSD
jgi:hypothetical protein